MSGDWRQMAFAEAVEINPRRSVVAGATVPYVEMAAVPSAGSSIEYLLQRQAGGGGAKFRNGDTLFARITPCAENGKTAFVDCLRANETGLGSTELIVFGPREGLTDPAYVYHLARSEIVRCPAIAQMVGTTGRARVPNNVFDEIEIALPPLHEQRRIAEILSSVDEAIAATRAVIAQTRKVKQAVLERLLTKGIGHTRFKQTEIGEIPEGWEVATLGSITVELEAGVSVNSESRPARTGEYGILKTSCVSGGFFDPSENKAVLSAERTRVKVPVKADRIIISRMNTPNLVGANGYVEHELDDIFLPDRLWQLKTSQHTRWLGAVLAADKTRSRLSDIATGTSGSMKNISKAKLLELHFAIPPKREQKEIADVIHQLDAAHRAGEQELLGLASTKSALMSDLLTGRRRVTDALPLAAE
ncbi:restriction endonuclease subunit S [Ancylobacter terrae]|uniref:restriction endonuclease subunit S n=1 Tax=Ancylobacter sp. sgz301288 TaxID=3342077 RepID=UPI00385F93EF